MFIRQHFLNSVKIKCNCSFSVHAIFSSIKEQLGKLAQRIDTLETNLHKDIRTILDILHQQQQMQLQLHQQQMQHQLLHQQQLQQHQQQYATGKQIATPYQPSESDFSFDLCGVADKSLTHLQQQQQPQRINVQRSVSQPECAASNEKSLFRYVENGGCTSRKIHTSLQGIPMGLV